MELWEEHREVLEKVEVMWVDAGYEGDKFALAVWLMIQARVEVKHRTETEFQVLPKRWVVERTFAGLNQYQRLSKDYERLPQMSEAAIYAVMTGIMLRRLSAIAPNLEIALRAVNPRHMGLNIYFITL